MFWSCVLAFCIILLFLSFLSFLFLHVLILLFLFILCHICFLFLLAYCEAWVFCHTTSDAAPTQDLPFPSGLVSWLWTHKCYQDEVLGVVLDCESNCLQTDLSLPLPFLLLFPIKFYLCSCPYLPLALCFLQLYCCCILVLHEQHWQFRTSKSHDCFFHCLEKKHCPGEMAQAGWLKFSGSF